MELQSPSNWTIVEVEKEVLEYVFNILTGITDKVFLDPDRKVVDLYILPLNEAVIVKPLLSEAPAMAVGDITAAAPEKILVDIVAEPNLFRAQQGELDRIYANAFREIPINQTKMLRYARRRHKNEAVFDLIPVEYRLLQTTKKYTFAIDSARLNVNQEILNDSRKSNRRKPDSEINRSEIHPSPRHPEQGGA